MQCNGMGLNDKCSVTEWVTPGLNDERSVTEWVTSGLPMMTKLVIFLNLGCV